MNKLEENSVAECGFTKYGTPIVNGGGWRNPAAEWPADKVCSHPVDHDGPHSWEPYSAALEGRDVVFYPSVDKVRDYLSNHTCTYDPVTGDGCGDPIHDTALGDVRE